MTREIIINDSNFTIEITKKFANLAKRFGTPEYDKLQTVKRDYPRYRVAINTTKKKADSFKGLTFDYMKNYILNHNEEKLAVFNRLRGLNEDGSKIEMAEAVSYGAIKQWFLDEFPEFRLQRKEVDEILSKKAA